MFTDINAGERSIETEVLDKNFSAKNCFRSFNGWFDELDEELKTEAYSSFICFSCSSDKSFSITWPFSELMDTTSNNSPL